MVGSRFGASLVPDLQICGCIALLTDKTDDPRQRGMRCEREGGWVSVKEGRRRNVPAAMVLLMVGMEELIKMSFGGADGEEGGKRSRELCATFLPLRDLSVKSNWERMMEGCRPGWTEANDMMREEKT